ncbi:MAG: molecular chaperone HtpG [Clostridiales bacterium]|nr:molecular chaperone HtpG [Clostridiales bacterium]
MAKKGTISVTTENIFPIIRKWLYSDQDIFVRELVSNGSDAISKYKRLVDLGEATKDDEEAYQLHVNFDSENGTIEFTDNGIGMTEEEVDKYINQIAFSGAMDFVEKYKEESTDASGIIGHFGLGFYSAFMVADKVRIDTKSFVAGEKAVSWESDDGMDYEIADSDKEERGTTITITLSEEAKKIFDAGKIRSVLNKYCAFMPFDLYYSDVVADRKREAEEAKKKKEAEEKGEEYKGFDNEVTPINNTEPLWKKAPKDCTDEEYKSFYRDVFHDFKEPLFWIHLNMDFPFHLQGILYFPKTNNVYETLEGRIKIYNHQVFVADNIEEVIPEFLFLLRGCLDCSDLPLNVSRSALQQDEYVKKLSSHIITKVSAKLNEVFKNDRKAFEGYWSDISIFVKYGMMKEEKFYEKVKDICLFKSVDGEFFTIEELTKAKDKDTIRYTKAPDQQAAYIEMAKEKGFDVVILNEELDNNFISFLEYKQNAVKFKRVDAELEGEAASEDEVKALSELFKTATSDDKLEVSAVALGADQLPAFIRETEESRRMAEMRKQFEQMRTGKEDDPYKDLDSMFPIKKDLVLNTDHPLVLRLLGMASVADEKEKLDALCVHLYDQARLAHGSLDSEGLKRFLKYNSELLTKVAENLK